MFDKHTQHPIPDGTIERIERSMLDAARNEARNFVSSLNLKSGGVDRTAGEVTNRNHAANGCDALPAKPVMPRLEPFHGEVKLRMKTAGITEKEAERAVRKELLHDAIVVTVRDPILAALLVAVLSFI